MIFYWDLKGIWLPMTTQETTHPSSADLELASAVQAALLSAQIPPCRCGRMVLRNRMSQGVGGDFYHFRPLGDDQVAFAIGDVAGHGMGPALIMTLILGVLRANHKDTRRPSRILGEINDLLVALGQRVNYFVTCSAFYGVVDLPTGILLYANAGHPHPIICHRPERQVSELPSTTMLLGVQSGELPESCHQFQRYDRLVLFTDGLPESQDGHGRFFGLSRLRSLVQATREDSPDQFADRLLADAAAFTGQDPPRDDQTLVVIDFDTVRSEG